MGGRVKKNLARLSLIAAVSAGMAFASTVPAQAYPYESGTKTCSLQYHVASASRGYGEMYARVGSLVVYKNASTVSTVYNTDQYWLRSSVYWETGAQYSYDYAYSGGYCEHV